VRVDEAMTKEPEIVSVSGDMPLKQLGRLLVERRISGVPVVDAGRRLVGVVSEGDILAFEAGANREQGLLARAAERPDAAAPTTADVMSSPPITIRPDRTVVQAARLMAERGVNRLPVVDEGGKLVGILARGDVVRAFARSDEEVAVEVRENVVEGILGLDPKTVEVAVEDGEVLLSGDVDTETSGRLLEYFASRVPGVVAVRSRLRVRAGEGAGAE
jgi:CBS domain-containing protein